MNQAEHKTLHSSMIRLTRLVAITLLASGVALVTAAPALASTLFGGSGDESATRSVQDASGNIYVASTTPSTDFPTTPGAFAPTYLGGTRDLYVAKFNSSLTTLLAATFVGGSGEEKHVALAIDSGGNILVASSTLSTDIPVTAGAYQTSKSSDFDVFVVKLDSDLTTVLAATYLGGSRVESWGSLSMGIDSADNPVLGFRSTSENFPTTVGAYDRTYNDYAPNHGDVVVAKLDSTLSNLLASTFIGGALWDEARVLHVDSDDTVLVGGDTQNSTTYGAFYPTTAGAYSTCANHAFSREAFLSRLSVDFSTLLASTCLGRSGLNDLMYGIRTAPDGSVVVIGRTEASTFPVTSGAFDTTYNGSYDAFVARFDSGLTTLAASTFLGGNAGDNPSGLLIDPAGNIHVTGSTSSTDFPTTVDGLDTSLDGASDGYHVSLDPDLENLDYGTFIGGTATDGVSGVFLLGAQLYLYGGTTSTDFPTSPGAYDESHNGGADGFITGLTPTQPVPADSSLARWITGGLLLALVSFAAWRRLF